MYLVLAAALSLLDQRSRPVTLGAFPDHPLVVSFVSARCSDVCPLIDAQIARAANEERARHGRLRFLTITLDPEHDTHADMVRLARAFDADPAYWRIASGQPQAVHALMREFGIETLDRGGQPIAHTSAIIVLDSARRVAAALLPSSTLAEQLAHLAVR